MKKILATLLTLALLCALGTPAAYADGGDTTYYVNNPDPIDRLHLRAAADEGAESLGKYYNGTTVKVINTDTPGWYLVRVGSGDGSLVGWMKSKFLTTKVSADYRNVMPMYVSTQKFTVYTMNVSPKTALSFDKGLHVYVMGFDENWWHIMIDLGGSEGLYTCFIPECPSELTNAGNAYVSNPDSKDRLHLRTAPAKNAKSLGKYYNGTETWVLGRSLDLEWSYVNVYGREGYMNSKYLCFNGEVNNTYTGLVSGYTTSDNVALRSAPKASAETLKTLPKGESIMVYGVLEDEGWLNVKAGDTMGFVKMNQTNYVNDR